MKSFGIAVFAAFVGSLIGFGYCNYLNLNTIGDLRQTIEILTAHRRSQEETIAKQSSELSEKRQAIILQKETIQKLNVLLEENLNELSKWDLAVRQVLRLQGDAVIPPQIKPAEFLVHEKEFLRAMQAHEGGLLGDDIVITATGSPSVADLQAMEDIEADLRKIPGIIEVYRDDQNTIRAHKAPETPWGRIPEQVAAVIKKHPFNHHQESSDAEPDGHISL